jgi:hypothetical protein
LKSSIPGIAAIVALALALPLTQSQAGTGPYWNCSWTALGRPPVSTAHFPRWTKAEARRHALEDCRRAGFGDRCTVAMCWHESGNPGDPGCKHCVLPHKAPWRPPYR